MNGLGDATEPTPGRLSFPPLPPALSVPLKVITCALVILGLYLGRDILVPLALAALFGFVLAPGVDALRRRRVPRGVAVATVVGLTLAAVLGVSGLVGSQLMQIGRDLPKYQDQVHRKLVDLRNHLDHTASMGGAARLLHVVEREVDATRQAIAPDAPTARTPQPVTVVPEPKPPLEAVGELFAPFVEPLLTAGIAVVLLFFILLERHDLRDRMIRLAGADIHTMSDALDEAAHRVSRYLGTQVLVNLCYGLPLSLGLWLIGVPGALVWGALAAVLRFVPYLGPVVAAAFPMVMALAVDPGWHMLVWTGGLILTLELLLNNVIEPLAYGSSTGLGTVALLLSAAFWTALWGPVGLVLSTPITVCLVVLGRHLPSLHFLELLLGREPAFDAPTRLYQRLLAGREDDAFDEAREQVREHGLAGFYDRAAVPAILLGQALAGDQAHALHRQRLSTGLRHLVRDLGKRHPHALLPSSAAPRIVCHGLRREADDLAADMLAQSLNEQGLATRLLPITPPGRSRWGREDTEAADVLCLSSFQRPSVALVRQACQRLRRERPALRIVLVLWSEPAESLEEPGPFSPAEWPGLGVEAVTNSIGASVQRLRALLSRPAPARAAVTPLPATPVAAGEPALPADDLGFDGTAAARHAAEVFQVRQGLVCWADGRIDSWPMRPGAAARELVHHLLSQAPQRQRSPGASWDVTDLARDPLVDATLGAQAG